MGEKAIYQHSATTSLLPKYSRFAIVETSDQRQRFDTPLLMNIVTFKNTFDISWCAKFIDRHRGSLGRWQCKHFRLKAMTIMIGAPIYELVQIWSGEKLRHGELSNDVNKSLLLRFIDRYQITRSNEQYLWIQLCLAMRAVPYSSPHLVELGDKCSLHINHKPRTQGLRMSFIDRDCTHV